MYLEQHGTNLQYLILKNNLFPPILSFLRNPSRRLQLVGAQFLSSCVLSGDTWYTKFIIKRDYFMPLLTYAEDHVEEDHCVMSVILACIQSVRNGEDKPMWEHIKSKLEQCPRLKHAHSLLMENPLEGDSKRMRLDPVL